MTMITPGNFTLGDDNVNCDDNGNNADDNSNQASFLHPKYTLFDDNDNMAIIN